MGWEKFGESLLDLAIAFSLGVPIGWEREHFKEMGPGLRTYPLLALGACAFLEVAQAAFPGQPDAQARVFQGMVSGIGFIGAGAIIKGRAEVHGLATAVSLWVTVCVGAAASYDFYLLAVLLSATTLITLWVLKPLRGQEKEVEADQTE